jgi:2-succinyl-6-hydroxy-2,4-cyclohexadiene-1-carboxylate synthase
LHGFSGSPESWTPVVARLAPRPVIVPPLFGHAPDVDGVETFEDEVHRLARVLRSADQTGGPFHLCGYSLGGRLAFGLLVHHPNLFVRATIIGAHPGLDDESLRVERVQSDEQWARLLENEGMLGFVERWQAQPLFATQARLPQAQRDRTRRERLRHDPHRLARAMRVLGLGTMPRFTPQLSSITVPVTAMAGELDAKFTALGARVARELPHGRLVVVPGVGHNVPLEDPDAVVQELRES